MRSKYRILICKLFQFFYLLVCSHLYNGKLYFWLYIQVNCKFAFTEFNVCTFIFKVRKGGPSHCPNSTPALFDY